MLFPQISLLLSDLGHGPVDELETGKKWLVILQWQQAELSKCVGALGW